ncbi:MAG TPA: universal stress protein, partial [Puia sp.]|nr:universal stress protein [Puia sp.]
MKKILVLVDFSAPSVNAVAYAADLAGDTGFGEIVLMANCYVPLFEQIVPSPDLVQVGAADIARKQEKTLLQLMALKSEIEKKLPATVLVRVILGSQSLLRSVLEQVAKEEPSVVIIGSNSRAPME